MIKKCTGALILTAALLFSGCYSVFNGGTGGQIVDAESTSIPKAGIANVDVYAYTDSRTRDSDYSGWDEGEVFSPSDSYYGHTTTDAGGNFAISNIVWKENHPDFGKDADYTTIYLLYYHENYGLTKDQTVITSDSTSDTVYAELRSIKKTTALNISIYDVTTSALSTNNVLVTVSVPQSTDTVTKPAKVYEQIITGNGTFSINYPRWQNEEAEENNIENTPQVTITYAQSADQITWWACANADNTAQDYSFLGNSHSISKVIKNSSYNIALYGKPTRIGFPAVNGVYSNSSAPSQAANDGVIISMKAKDSSGNFTIDCGETTTRAEEVGSAGTLSHGNFRGLGTGFYWSDSAYTGRYTTIDVKFFANGTDTGVVKTLRSDIDSYFFVISN